MREKHNFSEGVHPVSSTAKLISGKIMPIFKYVYSGPALLLLDLDKYHGTMNSIARNKKMRIFRHQFVTQRLSTHSLCHLTIIESDFQAQF